VPRIAVRFRNTKRRLSALVDLVDLFLIRRGSCDHTAHPCKEVLVCIGRNLELVRDDGVLSAHRPDRLLQTTFHRLNARDAVLMQGRAKEPHLPERELPRAPRQRA
jgi:hypothetical protein